MHLGPYPTPSREDRSPAFAAKFLLRSADLLEARAANAALSWSASRPSYICDFARSRARNLITGPRHLRGDLPGTRCAPGLSRKRRRLFRAVGIVGRDLSRRFERRLDLLMQKKRHPYRSCPNANYRSALKCLLSDKPKCLGRSQDDAIDPKPTDTPLSLVSFEPDS